MDGALLDPTFLFRFSVPCHRCDPARTAGDEELGMAYVMPSFGELEGRPKFADLRCAWSENGLLFTLAVTGKRQRPWCRATRIEDSDGLHVWIDTRDTHNIHRATQFCHRFAFLPTGGGWAQDRPLGRLLVIERNRGEPKPVAENMLRVSARLDTHGYRLRAYVPAQALTGFDPLEHPRLGFTYVVVDNELGRQTFSLGPEFPIDKDPSLWGSLELVAEQTRSDRPSRKRSG